MSRFFHGLPLFGAGEEGGMELGGGGGMRATGVEPARPFGHGNLNPARLPVPPRPRYLWLGC